MATPEDANLLLKGQSILSFSLERWSHVWRSRHHIMSLLALDNRILFASSPVYIRDVFRADRDGREETEGVSQISENLFEYIPSRWLPASYGYPSLNAVLRAMRCWDIRRAMRRLGMRRPILYLWFPSFVDMIGRFDEALVVYHCYDEYSAFVDLTDSARELLIAQEAALLKRADIVFTASSKLAARRRSLNENIHVVESGVDYDRFARARDSETPVPEDLRSIKPPIIGCVGTQMTIVDLVLLEEVFRRRPEWSFVFIGTEAIAEDPAGEALRAVQELPNVHFIGRRSIEAMPGYLKGCDICTVPWVLNDISTSGSPLKLYEYLATGKPVISTPLPHLRHLEAVVTFADGADQWISAIEHALSGESEDSVRRRQDVARKNTWQRRAHFIGEHLAPLLAERGLGST